LPVFFGHGLGGAAIEPFEKFLVNAGAGFIFLLVAGHALNLLDSSPERIRMTKEREYD
jgi:hypothetical protein